MKKFISLMNSVSFYYLWQNPTTRKYLLTLIADILKEADEYELLNTFNDESRVRNYVFLESNDKLIFIDFNSGHKDVFKMNLPMINYLRTVSNKTFIIVIFHDFKGQTTFDEYGYQIYQNNRNPVTIKLLLSKTIDEQRRYDDWGVIKYLYHLDHSFYEQYLNEATRVADIYNLLDL